jgi:hypothetical protein
MSENMLQMISTINSQLRNKEYFVRTIMLSLNDSSCLSPEGSTEPEPQFGDDGKLVGLPDPGDYARWHLAREANEFKDIELFEEGKLHDNIFEMIIKEYNNDPRVAKARVKREAILLVLNNNGLMGNPLNDNVVDETRRMLTARTHIKTFVQCRTLRRVFAYTVNPSPLIIANLAEQLMIRTRAVRFWFEYQRNKTLIMRTKSTVAVGINTSQPKLSIKDLQYEVRYAWLIQKKISKEGLVSIGLPINSRVDVELLALSLAIGIPVDSLESKADVDSEVESEVDSKFGRAKRGRLPYDERELFLEPKRARISEEGIEQLLSNSYQMGMELRILYGKLYQEHNKLRDKYTNLSTIVVGLEEKVSELERKIKDLTANTETI